MCWSVTIYKFIIILHQYLSDYERDACNDCVSYVIFDLIDNILKFANADNNYNKKRNGLESVINEAT